MDTHRNALMVDFEDFWGGGRVTLALCRDAYSVGGGCAILALIATDPARWDYLLPWGSLTVNLPNKPSAVSWCATEGNIILDTHYNPDELVDALVWAGIITLTGDSCRSGHCTYPFAKVAPWAMEAMGTVEETYERLSANLSGEVKLRFRLVQDTPGISPARENNR